MGKRVAGTLKWGERSSAFRIVLHSLSMGALLLLIGCLCYVFYEAKQDRDNGEIAAFVAILFLGVGALLMGGELLRDFVGQLAVSRSLKAGDLQECVAYPHLEMGFGIKPSAKLFLEIETADGRRNCASRKYCYFFYRCGQRSELAVLYSPSRGEVLILK